MTILRRGPDTFHLPPSLWEALQQCAMEEGWKPAGMVDVRSDRVYSGYTRSRVVGKCDAKRLAAALERFVNSKKVDNAIIDLSVVVGLVNFLRGGRFEIL